MEPEQKFRSIVGAILQIPESDVVDSLTPEQVDTWDSLNHITLIATLEQEFAVALDTEHLGHIQSITALKTVLRDKGIAL